MNDVFISIVPESLGSIKNVWYFWQFHFM